MKKITIAIDGGAGVGKGVTARGVAKALGYSYIDTGAMYRAVTVYLLENNIDPLDKQATLDVLNKINLTFVYNTSREINEIFLNNMCVEDKIRTPLIDKYVFEIALYPELRAFLVKQQKSMALAKGVVMEGRDIGTVVAPDAELKIHLVADLNIRAKRRQKQSQEKGIIVSFEEIKENLKKRDEHDLYGENSSSSISPDASEVDTSFLTIEEQIGKIVEMATEIISNGE